MCMVCIYPQYIGQNVTTAYTMELYIFFFAAYPDSLEINVFHTQNLISNYHSLYSMNNSRFLISSLQHTLGKKWVKELPIILSPHIPIYSMYGWLILNVSVQQIEDDINDRMLFFSLHWVYEDDRVVRNLIPDI